jgi:hypothetical protein
MSPQSMEKLRYGPFGLEKYDFMIAFVPLVTHRYFGFTTPKIGAALSCVPCRQLFCGAIWLSTILPYFDAIPSPSQILFAQGKHVLKNDTPFIINDRHLWNFYLVCYVSRERNLFARLAGGLFAYY